MIPARCTSRLAGEVDRIEILQEDEVEHPMWKAPELGPALKTVKVEVPKEDLDEEHWVHGVDPPRSRWYNNLLT